ncbi:MAG: ADP-ribosylglycohydrolase family protein [Clostridia bacterium]|nr:ADP-ribosylglycohydrolase family protein [Clostridia bacterium]
MLGAIIGDIAGSRFEWHNIKSKDFTLFHDDCRYTDDTAMTVARAWALLQSKGRPDRLGSRAVRCMREIGRRYPGCGYGGRFQGWLFSGAPRPYFSFGNGAAMRVSPCGFAADSLDEAIELAGRVTEVTHNHPEGIKGAEATAAAIYLARSGASIADIKAHICRHYYPIDFTLDGIRETYRFDESCMGTVPQALEAFFESTGFEDAIRNAISIGGDSDTLAAITGGVAEAYYGIPDGFAMTALSYLDDDLIRIAIAFEKRYPRRR